MSKTNKSDIFDWSNPAAHGYLVNSREHRQSVWIE